MFTRLRYYARAHLGFSELEVWLEPIGSLLDLWESHKQYNGMAKPKKELFIDEIIPEYL